MKKQIFILVSIFFIIAIGCKKNPEDLLIGKWKGTNIVTSNKVSQENKAEYEKQLKEIIEKYWLEFKKDYSYEAYDGTTTNKGIWKYDTLKKILSLTEDNNNQNNKPKKVVIRELTEKKMVQEFIELENKTTIIYQKE